MPRRTTQAEVAKLAGVSQTTVSLVLNGTKDVRTRVGGATERRVLEAIRETGYVVNPLARSLTEGASNILGVFTYEPVFPRDRADFYQPFMVGIESAAEALGVDLLLFTSAPNHNGRRRIVDSGWNRLRFTDGCIMLGQYDDKEDVATLLSQRFPFVFIGRREIEGAAVPHIAAAYTDATRDVTERLIELGHRSIGFLGILGRDESSIDRITGYRDAMQNAGLRPIFLEQSTFNASEIVDLALDNRLTAFVVGPKAPVEEIAQEARLRGLAIPGALSIAMLGDPATPLANADEWSGFRLPREQMGAAALELLQDMVKGEGALSREQSLRCISVEGSTVGPPDRHQI